MLDWLRPPPGLPPRINNMFYAARLKIDGLEFDHILCNRSVTFWAPPGDPIPEDRGGSSPPRRRGKGGSLRARRAHGRTAAPPNCVPAVRCIRTDPLIRERRVDKKSQPL